MISRTFMIIFCLLAPSSFAQQDPIEIVVYDSFPPFSFVQDGKMTGIYPDALKVLFEEELGIPVMVTGYPWARAQLKVKEGSADGFVTVPTPERLEYTLATKVPLAQGAVAIYTSVENPLLPQIRLIKDLNEVFQFPLVSYRGNGWIKDQSPATAKITWVTDPQNMLPLLSTTRPFVSMDSEPMMDWFIKSADLKERILKVARFNPVDQFLCIGKTSRFAPLLPKMEEGIRKMQAEGRLQAVLDRYR